MKPLISLYESIDTVPLDEWSALSDTNCFMQPNFLRSLERTLPDSARMFQAVIRAENGQLAACASLCLYPVDLLSLASPTIRDCTAWVRRLVPGQARFKILMCGVPFSAGQSHLAFSPGADRRRILEQLDLLLRQLARREGARFIVFKEFDEQQRADLDSLLAQGYVRGDSPAMYDLENRFASFEEYSTALKAHYRTNIKRSRRKFAAAGCRFARLTNPQDIRRIYTPEVHRLYEAVVMNSKTRLEILPHRFFLELVGQLPGQVALTVAYREDRMIGFTWELNDGPVYRFLFLGIDYSQIAQTDLYFNLVYKAMDHAFRSAAQVIHVGQTADGFKSLLGCSGNRRYIYARGTGPAFSWLLRQFSGFLFPSRSELAPHHVFNARQAPRESRELCGAGPL